MEADSFTIFPEYSSPPTRRTPANDRPTLLITYWCALLGIALIICRTVGRLVRIAKLYRDDKWMLATTILSLARLGFAHMVLLYGTNNTDGLENMSEEEVQKRTIGSGMVLGARVFFAAYIWSQKFCITEFYLRLTVQFWARSIEVGQRFIRWSLLVTYIAVLISIFAECRPPEKLLQVRPAPPLGCRLSYISLVTSSGLSVATDALLILSPIAPIVQSSSFSIPRKIWIILTTFSLPLFTIGLTVYRVRIVVRDHGSQQIRTILASFEMLLATVVANVVIVNSFARDRGERKKRKPYQGSPESGIASEEDTWPRPRPSAEDDEEDVGDEERGWTRTPSANDEEAVLGSQRRSQLTASVERAELNGARPDLSCSTAVMCKKNEEWMKPEPKLNECEGLLDINDGDTKEKEKRKKKDPG